jgi:outer membrane receptor protein involved in Fe transport
MKPNKTPIPGLMTSLCLGLLIIPLNAVIAQEESGAEESGEVFELSPFEVDTSSDRGYYAANTISGSRINIALQDMPMPIEVITSEFIEDTGSIDLRESLRYSSGILLETQSPSDGLEGVPGGVHNGQGATANLTNTTIKMRGFLTESSLRKGYRRQHGSDSINIDRIEVVRGPAALLYGIGNFGGIVNYLPKRPLTYQQTQVTGLVGSDQQYRATLDTTGPINDQLGYRVTAAAEDADHWTDVQNSNSFFISPVIVYKPLEKTKITLDFEIGTDTTNGVGFQAMRARATAGPNGDEFTDDQIINQQERLQKGGFVVFDGIDNRTFRLSGPDTYIETDANNLLVEVEQNIFDGLDVMVGYNRADAVVDKLDIISNAYNVGVGPENLRGTITIEPFRDQSGAAIYDAEIGEFTTVNNAVLMYMWENEVIDQVRDEFKAEATYSFDLFQDRDWLAQKHMILGGVSFLEQEKDTRNDISGGQSASAFLYKAPDDHSLIRFGQGVLRDIVAEGEDENPDGIVGFKPLLPTKRVLNISKNKGLYAVWQGRFWDDRITTIVGVRDDTSRQDITDFTFENGMQTGLSRTAPPSQSETTYQYGISVEVMDGVTVFALTSEGLEPNFDGLRDGYGVPIGATKAESEEIGVKLNLMDGKLAATISAYRLNVLGPSKIDQRGGLWWAPAPAKGRYDPTQATVYDLGWAGLNDENGAFVENEALWEAAVAAGNVSYDPNDGEAILLTVLDENGNETAGAAFMDAMYKWAADGNGWPGWMFRANDFPDTLANNAAMDWAADNIDWFAGMVAEEESEGVEIQLLYSPTKNIQLYASYAHTERQVIDQGKMPRYPHTQDRWPLWYFPDGNWGLQGVSLEEAYGDPSDTSTWTGGPATTNGQQMDDTPEHDFSFWGSYAFDDGPLEGLRLGFGGTYQSKREYLSGFTAGGDAIRTEDGQRIKLYTDSKLQFNAMLRYDYEYKDRPAFVQLNIDNLTNDKDLYGYVYEPGIIWRLQAGITF